MGAWEVGGRRGVCPSLPSSACFLTPPTPVPHTHEQAQVMHRFHFSSLLKRMSTVVRSEAGGAERCVCARGWGGGGQGPVPACSLRVPLVGGVAMAYFGTPVWA